MPPMTDQELASHIRQRLASTNGYGGIPDDLEEKAALRKNIGHLCLKCQHFQDRREINYKFERYCPECGGENWIGVKEGDKLTLNGVRVM